MTIPGGGGNTWAKLNGEIRTHPVYPNLLCCIPTGQAIVEKIFANKPSATAWVPYINAGFCLNLEDH